MARSLLLVVVLAMSGCYSYPEPVLPVQLTEIEDRCNTLLGSGWRKAGVPANARQLNALTSYPVRPVGLLWYTSSKGGLASCAYTRDAHGCGFSAHFYSKRGEVWRHTPGAWLERICVLG